MKESRVFCGIFLFCLLSFYSSLGQNKITGTVKDAKTGKSLAFATIIFNGNPSAGTIADIQGNFSISSSEKIRTLTASYIGFNTKTIPVNQPHLEILLSPSENELDPVIIDNKNPAHAIMKKVIANRKRNNPENLSSFIYKSYNKIVFDFKFDDKKLKDSIEIDTFLQGGNLFLMESVTERKFVAPNKSEEQVLATRVSGFQNPSFAALATDLQPFSFYQENINLMENYFLNPISEGSLKKYKFHLKETLFRDTDTIHIISFEPLPKKNFNGLKGLLYINTNKYAIQNLIASPAKEAFIDIKIQQKYQLIDDEYWFPEQLNFEMIFKNNPEEGVNLSAEGKSFIDSVKIGMNLNPRDFSLASIIIKEDAGKKDSTFWKQNRFEPLNEAEQTTYKIIDSLGAKNNFDKILELTEKLPQGKIPIGFVDFDLTRTFYYNKYEGFRIGTGIYTNEKLFDRLSFGGFLGYGLEDHEWKYGAAINYEISEEKQFSVSLKYKNTIREIGTYGDPLFTSEEFLSTRDYLAYKMDHITAYEVSSGFRLFKYAKVRVGFTNTDVTPLFEYEFHDENRTYTNYTNSTFNLGFTYAYNEELIKASGTYISLGTNYPVFSLNYSRGIKNVFESDFEFQKIEAGLEQSFYSKNLGTSRYRIQAGYIVGDLPLGLLYTGNGSRNEDFPVAIENTFQTMKLYEFISDQYLHVFLTHDFGSLLFKTENFAPGIVLHHNFGWGNLENPEAHEFVEFKTMSNVYLEAGLGLEDLIKINYLDLAYLGLGVGAFYRYGPYSYNDPEDNLALKMSFELSFF